jgi:hypothetical protein
MFYITNTQSYCQVYTFSNTLDHISGCIDKCVTVNYNNNTPYLGYVEDGDSSDIFVVCMHRVYKKMEMNVFFWPTAVKDKYWYKQEHRVTVKFTLFPTL